MCCSVSLAVLFVRHWGKGNTCEEVSSYIPHTACGKWGEIGNTEISF